MAGEGVDVRHKLRRARPGCCAAHASVKTDPQAAVPTLVRADNQFIIGDGAVEAGPVVVVKGVVEFTGDGCHRGDPVGLAIEQGTDAPEDVLVPSSPFGG